MASHFLRGLEGKVFELHGWAKRGFGLHRVSALLPQRSPVVFLPQPLLFPLLQQQAVSSLESQPAAWQKG